MDVLMETVPGVQAQASQTVKYRRRFSTGNRNRNKPKYSHPFEPRIAKYVRFNVVNKRHRNWPCMRVELFGQKGSRQAQVTHSLANNMAVYPDIRPRVSSLYSGSDVLIVLPKARYLPGKIVAALGNNLYEVRRSVSICYFIRINITFPDNGKTEIMRRDYLRQK
ncbi:hypothetical protein QZH41_012185, partial [Actinostola sp. cb2023]